MSAIPLSSLDFDPVAPNNMLFDKEKLLDIAEQYQESFKTADPFPHVVMDNFLPLEMAEAALESFPSQEVMEQQTYQSYENKIAMRPDNVGFPPALEHLLNSLNSSKFISFCEVLTGINGLIPDPHFQGAGLHQTMPGGKLGMHVDFNMHKGLGLYRRLNLILYLNKDWQDEWKGHLELWDKDMQNLKHRIAPVFNRAVIFETRSDSWHGHPDPLAVPEGMTRKSLALYYYTSDKGNQSAEAHWTRHQARPDSMQDGLKRKTEQMLYQITPPILHRAVRKVLSR